MELGNWEISANTAGIKTWSSGKTELMLELDGRKLAELDLVSDDKVNINPYNCKITVDANSKTISILPKKQSSF